LTLPQAPGGTFSIFDVARLEPDQQAELCHWLDAGCARARVISISSLPLFPLVERGTFDRGLFYRLNVIRMTWPPALVADRHSGVRD
jgi:transcriptional regulator of aromatic amino acid metabolism